VIDEWCGCDRQTVVIADDDRNDLFVISAGNDGYL
jgi:hypothetical protein